MISPDKGRRHFAFASALVIQINARSYSCVLALLMMVTVIDVDRSVRPKAPALYKYYPTRIAPMSKQQKPPETQRHT